MDTYQHTIQVNWFNGTNYENAVINQELPPAYAQCWSITPESDTLLRAYSRVVKNPHFNRNIHPRDEGVRVRSTPKKLLEALINGIQSNFEVSCYIGTVRYYPQEKLLQEIANAVGSEGLNVFEHPDNRAQLLLMKREAFSHEAEVRLIAAFHKSALSDSILHIKFDPNTVFDEITFDPRLGLFEQKERESAIRSNGYIGAFGKSELYNPLFLFLRLDKPPKK